MRCGISWIVLSHAFCIYAEFNLPQITWHVMSLGTTMFIHGEGKEEGNAVSVNTQCCKYLLNNQFFINVIESLLSSSVAELELKSCWRLAPGSWNITSWMVLIRRPWMPCWSSSMTRTERTPWNWTEPWLVKWSTGLYASAHLRPWIARADGICNSSFPERDVSGVCPAFWVTSFILPDCIMWNVDGFVFVYSATLLCT